MEMGSETWLRQLEIGLDQSPDICSQKSI